MALMAVLYDNVVEISSRKLCAVLAACPRFELSQGEASDEQSDKHVDAKA